MFKTQQTDDEICEDQLLNFLVNSLSEEIVLPLAENAEFDAEDIYEVLVGACADGTSVPMLRERSEDAPHENSVLYHLHTKFDLETLKQAGNMFLRKDVLDALPQQVEVCIDLHLRPYHGGEGDTDGLYHLQAKYGTTVFHAYATLHAHAKNERYTLVVRYLEDDGTASSAPAEFLGILDGFDLGVKAVYLDREFYDSKCLTLLQAHDHAYVMPIVRWERTIKRELSEGWGRVIQHSLTARLDSYSWIVEFPVYIDYTYQNGRYSEHGVARHGYAADASFIDSPRDARYHYARRLGIETSYRLSEQDIAMTSAQNPVVRLLYVVMSLLLQNMWRYLHWEYATTPCRGGCRLWQWPFKRLINMIRRTAWTAPATCRVVPANRPPDDQFHR